MCIDSAPSKALLDLSLLAFEILGIVSVSNQALETDLVRKCLFQKWKTQLFRPDVFKHRLSTSLNKAKFLRLAHQQVARLLWFGVWDTARFDQGDVVTHALSTWLATYFHLSDHVTFSVFPKKRIQEIIVKNNRLSQSARRQRIRIRSLQSFLKGITTLIKEARQCIRTYRSHEKLIEKSFLFIHVLRYGGNGLLRENQGLLSLAICVRNTAFVKIIVHAIMMFRLQDQEVRATRIAAARVIQMQWRLRRLLSTPLQVDCARAIMTFLHGCRARRCFKLIHIQKCVPLAVALLTHQAKLVSLIVESCDCYARLWDGVSVLSSSHTLLQPRSNLLLRNSIDAKFVMKIGTLAKMRGWDWIKGAMKVASKHQHVVLDTEAFDDSYRSGIDCSLDETAILSRFSRMSQTTSEVIATRRKSRTIRKLKLAEEDLNEQLFQACMAVDKPDDCVCDGDRVGHVLNQGASLSVIWENGHTPLSHFACTGTKVMNSAGESVLAVQFILDRQRLFTNHQLPCLVKDLINQENKRGNTPLMEAAMCSQLEVMCCLLDREADLHHEGSNGHTALTLAAMYGKVLSFKFLLHRGADRNVLWERKSVLGQKTYVDIVRESGDEEIIRILSLLERNAVIGFPFVGFEQARRCTSGCGELIKITEGQAWQDHELYHCSKRTIPCPLRCAEKALFVSEVEAHVAEDCPLRKVSCPNRCKEQVRAMNLDSHLASSCLERQRRCAACRQFLISKDKTKHEEKECVRREVDCDSHCGMKLLYQDLRDHRRFHCELRMVRCRNQPCSQVIAFKDRDSHEEKCLYSVTRCRQDCGLSVLKVDLMHHEQDLCPKRLVSCSLKCSELVHADSLSKHEGSLCRRRFVPCQLGCEMKVQPDFQHAHEKKMCSNASVSCENAGCMAVLRRSEMAFHCKHTCEYSEVQCSLGCGIAVQKHALQHHRDLLCSKRLVHCCSTTEMTEALHSNNYIEGCIQMVSRDALEDHRRFECRSRTIHCENGCDALVRGKHQHRHDRTCPLKNLECSLGCGKTMKRWQLEHHKMNVCIRRSVAQ